MTPRIRFSMIGLLGVIFVTISFVVFSTTHTPVYPPEATKMADVRINGAVLNVLVAQTDEARAQGLAGVTNLDTIDGMLFVSKTSARMSIWMKGMLIPIDILWIDDGGSVLHIEHSVAPETYPETFTPPVSARYVLEVASGFASEHGINVGTRMQFFPGTF